MVQTGGKPQTFVVKIVRNQNDTVQGTITWTAAGKTRSFRSMMELLRLMDSAQEMELETHQTRKAN